MTSTFQVWLSGDVNASMAQALTGVVQDFCEASCSHVTVELADVWTMDLCAVSMLLALGDVARERGGIVTLVGPPASCLGLLELRGQRAPTFAVKDPQAA